MNKGRNTYISEASEYRKGYTDGMRAAYEETDLDAYYAGVGYGKRQAGDKNIGFSSDTERREFEKGISKKDEHFNSYRVKELSLWERLFGKKPPAKKTVRTKETVRDRVRRTNKGRKATKKKRAKTGGKRSRKK